MLHVCVHSYMDTKVYLRRKSAIIAKKVKILSFLIFQWVAPFQFFFVSCINDLKKVFSLKIGPAVFFFRIFGHDMLHKKI